MLYLHSTEKLLGLKDVMIKNIEEKDGKTEIHMEMPVKPHTCPRCGECTRKVHDYRVQRIKDIPAFGKQTVLLLRKRRYRCSCGKCFYEKVHYLPRYYRMTNRFAAYVIDKLRTVCSFTSVAKEVGVSTPTVIRIFDIVQYGKPKLPEVLAIDEFKGNTGSEKYQCILTDPHNHVVLDILPKRCGSYLTTYFKPMNRSPVRFFVSDMWRTYTDFASTFFSDATQIIDKYHFIRQVVWAFEVVRKEEQKKFNKSHRIYFKRSKTLLTKRFDYLTEEQKQQVNVMLYSSAKLSSSHFLKELFYRMLDANDKQTAKKLMSEWIMSSQNSDIPAFVSCSNTFINWSNGIMNSFDHPYTNGFTEGCNNKIKVLKRNAYGYRNFSRFRNRILHIFSHQNTKKMATA